MTIRDEIRAAWSGMRNDPFGSVIVFALFLILLAIMAA